MNKQKLVLAGLLITAAFIISCKKNDEKGATNGTASCNSISDDAIIMDGVSYIFQPAQAHNCGSGALNGGTVYTHFMSVHDGTIHTPGVSYNQPDINITFSSVPPAGMTTTFILDNGIWLISATPPPTGHATFRMSNYYVESNQQVQSWFSDGQSGNIDATTDAGGNVTISFSDVQLVQNGGSLDARKTLCGKNLICH